MAPSLEFGIPLVCPKCRTPVVQHGPAFVCTSGECRLSYPIIDGIPKFLIDDAAVLPPDNWCDAMRPNGQGPAATAP